MGHGPRRTQAERVAESRARLLDAAIDLFADCGFAGTTAMEIGLHAGYSRSMVRERFGSKEELLRQLLASEFEPRMTAQLPPDAAGRDLIMSRLDAIFDLIRSEPRLMRAFWALSFEPAGSDPIFGQWFRAWLDSYEEETVEALRTGQRDGSVRLDLDAPSAARAMVQTGLGIAFLWRCRDGDGTADDIARWRAEVEAQLTPVQRNAAQTVSA